MATGEKLTCCYCGREVANQTAKGRHEPRCLQGPEVGARVRSFLYAHAVDGVAMSSRDYDRLRDEDMLSSIKISRQFGSWSGYLRSIGLRIPSTYKVKSRAAKITRVKEDTEDDNDVPIRDFSKLLAMHEWKPRAMVYGGRKYQEEYTVLR